MSNLFQRTRISIAYRKVPRCIARFNGLVSVVFTKLASSIGTPNNTYQVAELGTEGFGNLAIISTRTEAEQT